MEVLDKICPFRFYESIKGNCLSECQLFVPGRDPNTGTCSLAATQGILYKLKEISHILAK